MDAKAFAIYKRAIERAEELFRAGRFEAAFDAYLDLLDMRLFKSLPPGAGLENAADVVATDRLAHLAVLFGYHDAADALLDSLASSSFSAGNFYLSAYSTLTRVHLALSRGLLHVAEQCLFQIHWAIGDLSKIDFSPHGLAVWENRCQWGDEAEDHVARAVLFSRLYFALGTHLCTLGQYREALAALQRGLVHVGNDAPDLARRMSNPLQLASASAALESGSLGQARDILESLQPGFDLNGDPGVYIEWLECSSKLHMLTGEFGAAVEYLEEVVRRVRMHGFSRAEIVAMLNLAHIRILLNQTAVAMELLDQIQVKARSFGDKSNELRARFLRATAYAREQSLAPHEPIAPSATEMWNGDRQLPRLSAKSEDIDPSSLPQLPSYLAFFEDRALGVHWYLGQNDFDAARCLYEEMLTVFETTDSMLIQLRLKALAGTIAYYRSDWSNAESLLGDASHDARGMGLKPELWQLLRLLAWSKTRLGRSDSEVQKFTQEAEGLLGEMTASLQGEQRAIFLLNKWTVEEEDLAREIDALIRLRRRYQSSPWFKKLIQYWPLLRSIGYLMWRVDRHKVLATSRVLAPKSNPTEKMATKPSLVRRLLGGGRKHAVIAFLVLPDRVLVMCKRRLRLDFGVSAITRIQLRDLVKQWHTIISGAGAPEKSANPSVGKEAEIQTQELRNIARYLEKALQLPSILARMPKQVSALTIVPDDILHGFPFAVMAHEGHYLIERFSLTIGFESLPERPKARRAATKKALIVGVSKVVETAARLTGVRRELDKIEAIIGKRGWQIEELCDESASPEALLESLPGSGLFHVASHGIFQPEQPDHSGLILTSKGGRIQLLTLRQISGLDLRSLRLATLSSCWSADNFVLPGRWIISLPETFYRAGAHSVLGSLWKVPDELAIDFMEHFYLHLQRYPLDRALQLVQIECLHNEADIRFWANFNLYGSREFLKP